MMNERSELLVQIAEVKPWLVFGACFGFLGVALGAFGAHALKTHLSEKEMSIFQTAVQYQMFHAVALLVFATFRMHLVGLSPDLSFLAQAVGFCFTLGIFLFSGSLYALTLTQFRLLGVVTPIGGGCFLLAWIGFAFLVVKA